MCASCDVCHVVGRWTYFAATRLCRRLWWVHATVAPAGHRLYHKRSLDSKISHPEDPLSPAKVQVRLVCPVTQKTCGVQLSPFSWLLFFLRWLPNLNFQGTDATFPLRQPVPFYFRSMLSFYRDIVVRKLLILGLCQTTVSLGKVADSAASNRLVFSMLKCCDNMHFH